MTAEHASDSIRIVYCDTCDADQCDECLFEESMKALEKQIPKKPDVEGDGYADGHLVYDTWICPNCEEHYEIDYDNYDYCPKCGQKLDWSSSYE